MFSLISLSFMLTGNLTAYKRVFTFFFTVTFVYCSPPDIMPPYQTVLFNDETHTYEAV